MLRILTLTYRGKDKLEALYPGLMNQLSTIDYKWYIKENGSNDQSIELINSWNNPNVIGIDYPHNKDTFSYGCNYLFNECKSDDEDLILLLNNDIIFKDNKSLKNMISIINNDSSVGVVGAKLMFEDNSIAHAGVVFSKYSNKLPTHYRAREKDDKEASKNREFQAVTGACLLTKSKYYKNICDNKGGLRGLDNELIWCFDDISACLSIKYEMKKKIIYCGSTNIVHNESSTLKVNPVNKLFSNHNVNYFRKKWSSFIIDDKDLYEKSNKHMLYKAK
jgi:GT2 family glycosyltransferase